MQSLTLMATDIVAEWDLLSFLNSAKGYTQTVGGAFLSLVGVVAIIWGGYKLVKKLMSPQGEQQTSWFVIVAMILIGGALAATGITLLSDIATGGQKTIEDLGGGMIFLESILG